jgi:metal-dependent amidase/aminoacylase/carboxypeptidase family protein
VGAFLGLAAVLADGSVPGTALLLGTPAEEGGGGKELMARDGAFDGVDAVVMLHHRVHPVEGAVPGHQLLAAASCG